MRAAVRLRSWWAAWRYRAGHKAARAIGPFEDDPARWPRPARG